MKTEILNACDQVVTAAMNGCCQGILLALLVGLGLRLLGRTNAATRHAAWLTTLLLVVFLFPAHYWRQHLVSAHRGPMGERMAWRDAQEPALAPAAPGGAAVAAGAAAGAADSAQGRTFAAGSLGAKRFGLRQSSAAFWTQGTRKRQRTAAVQNLAASGSVHREPPMASPEAGRVGPEAVGTGTSLPDAQRPQGSSFWRAERFLEPVSWNLAAVPFLPPSTGLILLAAWVAVAGARMLLLVWRLGHLRKLKRTSIPASDGLKDLFNRERARLGVARRVELKISRRHRSAIVLGFVHPVILLPEAEAGTGGSVEREHILRHELAHVLRRDDWANLLQHFIEAALFFHPAVVWICRRLAIEREIACDDCVLQQGVGPRPYALLLANLAARMQAPHAAVAPGASSSKSQLQQRIAMILNTHRNISPRPAKGKVGIITSAAALVAVLALYSGPRLVLAQDQAQKKAPPAPQSQGDNTPDSAAKGAPDLTPAPPNGVEQEEQETTPAQAPTNVAPGAKYKPDTGEATLPLQTPGINAPVPPGAPPPPASDWTGLQPDMPPPGASIEQRLARLEQMVRALMAKQGLGRPQIAPQPKRPADEYGQLFDGKRLKDYVQSEVARAMEQAKRAVEEATRAAQKAQDAVRSEASRFQSDAARYQNEIREQIPAKQLEALQKQREALERQMERLDRQIERLEQGLERKEARPHRNRNQNQGDEPKADKSMTQPPASLPSDSEVEWKVAPVVSAVATAAAPAPVAVATPAVPATSPTPAPAPAPAPSPKW